MSIDLTSVPWDQVVENLHQGIFVIDKNAKIIYANSFLSEMLGHPSYELLEKNIFEFFDNDSINFFKEALNATTDTIQQDYELKFTKKDKTTLSILIHITPFFNKKYKHIGILVAMQDISARKSMEYELHAKLDLQQKSELATLNIMEDLQNTISALTQAETEIRKKNIELQKINSELTSARKELTFLNEDLEKKVKERTADVEKLLKQKDEFISQLGHDLKTPLTPLNILIPLIKEREQDPKIKELLDVIFNNVQYMKNLVIKTLELAQLNSPNAMFEFHDVNLFDYLHDILDLENTLFEGKNVVIENNIPAETIVQADILQVRELFDNLISNAIKYSKDDQVKITLNAKRKDDLIVISVKDTGIGLEPNQIQHVFDEFYKVDYSRHDLKSTGLGLTICKRIVEKHGGSIWVESPGTGKGSTFFFTLKSPNKIVLQNSDMQTLM
ncbi:MAG TPA: hypothetical protein DSN98_01100 [Thermoplasmata archaeon]|jgi:PAS domain S-box-containing protein|nr:MAG TPA: hypothetical protein DSN98_01100 [Thermoplasmata archaeon]